MADVEVVPARTDVIVVGGVEQADVVEATAVIGPQGPRGLKGDKGDTGTLSLGTVATGAPGTSVVITNTGTATAGKFNFTIPRGDKGATGTLSLGTVSTGAAGTNATITNTGTPEAGIFNFVIPKGDKGDTGTVNLGTVSTGAPGSAAAITNTGTATNGIFNFTIPRGDKGATGTMSLGTVTTGAPGTNVAITNTGTPEAGVFNFTIPRGDKGDRGTMWLQGAGVPATGTGLVGDWYLNTTNQDVYEKTATTTWTLRSNIKGATGTLSLGTVSTGAAGSAASITNTGTPTAGIFNFVIPQGIQGIQGPSGTIAVGTVSTGAAGSAATITNSGSSTNAVFNFTIPQGIQGIKGDKGDKGDRATLAVGTVTTGAVGTTVTITNTGTINDGILNFTIPRGAGVPTGGLAGQYLRKLTGADFDTQWVDVPAPVNMVTTDTTQTIAGAKTFSARVTAGEFLATDDFIAPRGTAANVGYGFSDNGDTGMWSAGTNLLNFAVGGTDRIALTATAETHTLPVTINNTLTVNNATTTIGSTTAGSINTLNFANPGIGSGVQQIQFLRATDSAGMRVTEATSDTLLYQFYMSDNPDQPDDFSWFYSDHQGTGGNWEPIRIGTVGTNFRATNHNFFGNITQRTTPWYSSNGVQDTVNKTGTGTLTATPGVTGYTGTTTVYWTRIDGTPLGNVTGLTATAVADAASTLAAATYYYTVTAVNATGETLVSNEPSVVTAAGQRVDLAWALPTGTSVSAITYNVYRNTVAATNASRVRVATGLTARTYSDVGAATTAVVPPTTNTTKNTFAWGTGATNTTASATGVVITAAAQTLSLGATVTFNATTGGVVGDTYQWRAYSGGTLNAGIVRGTQVFDNGSRVFSAQNYNHATTVTTANTYGLAAVVGTGTAYARNDHHHGTPPAQTITGGTGITATLSGVNYTLANTGVTSAVAGTGIGVSGATGAVTFTNTGVTSAVAGSNVTVSGATGAVTIGVAASPSFTNVTASGTITGGTIIEGTARVYSPNNPQPMTGYATQAEVDSRINAIIDAAPGTLDTLNELAAAIGDDPNFATTMTNNINTRALDTAVVHLAGAETISGNKQFNSIIGLGDTQLRFRGTTDANHYIGFGDTVINGPHIAGYLGGRLGITSAGSFATILTWTGSGVVVNTGTLAEGANRVYSAGNANLATTVTSDVTYGKVAAVGTGTAYARHDHSHGTPPSQTISVSGAGITATASGVNYTLANTGVTSNVAGTGISVSGATGAVTITNTGVLSAVAGTGIGVSAATGSVTFTNTGVLSVAGRTGAVTLTTADVGGSVDTSNPQTIGGVKTFSSVVIGANGLAGEAFRVGNDASLWDVDVANRIQVRGIANTAIGEIQLGLAGPVIGGTGSAVTVTGTLNTTSTLTENGARVYSANNFPGVTSVAGRAGAVTLTAADIAGGTFGAGNFTFPAALTATAGTATFGSVVLNNITGGSGTGYSTATLELFENGSTIPVRLSFHMGGVVASQIGMNSAGEIRTYDNPGTGYATFRAGQVFDNDTRVYSPANPFVDAIPFHVGGTVGTGLKSPKWIAPQNGTLRYARAWIDTQAANGTSWQIYVNGAAVSGAAYVMAAAATLYTNDFADVNFNAGDRIQLFVNAADATATELSVTVGWVPR